MKFKCPVCGRRFKAALKQPGIRTLPTCPTCGTMTDEADIRRSLFRRFLAWLRPQRPAARRRLQRTRARIPGKRLGSSKTTTRPGKERATYPDWVGHCSNILRFLQGPAAEAREWCKQCMSKGHYLREWRTIRFGGPRQCGKTTALRELCKRPNTVVIVPYAAQTELFAGAGARRVCTKGTYTQQLRGLHISTLIMDCADHLPADEVIRKLLPSLTKDSLIIIAY